jgi:hypothetical protein
VYVGGGGDRERERERKSSVLLSASSLRKEVTVCISGLAGRGRRVDRQINSGTFEEALV